MWDTFKIAQICYFFVASFLSSGNLCIFVQGDSSYSSPFSLLCNHGGAKYSLAFRITHVRNITWPLVSNILPNSGGNVTISPAYSPGGTMMNPVIVMMSTCPSGGLSHHSSFGKSIIGRVFFLEALLLSGGVMGVGRNRSIASWWRGHNTAFERTPEWKWV